MVHSVALDLQKNVSRRPQNKRASSSDRACDGVRSPVAIQIALSLDEARLLTTKQFCRSKI
jgi:hypothetical protein